MTFKTGQSGNPKGRAKGSVNRRTQLAKLIEPHAEQLVAKMVDLALGGDVAALRLCIERLIPKIRYEPTGIELPSNMNENNLSQLKGKLLLAALDGTMSIDDVEKLTNLISVTHETQGTLISMPKLPCDAIAAAKVYQQIMMKS